MKGEVDFNEKPVAELRIQEAILSYPPGKNPWGKKNKNKNTTVSPGWCGSVD